MRKMCKRVLCCLMLAALVWCGTLIADRQRLRESVIRFHVVAASDSREDQTLKLRVRDAVAASLQAAIGDMTDVEQAREYIRTRLPVLQRIAEETLRDAGVSDTVKVSFTEEAFGKRVYDTFSLPAGIYETLKIEIGAAEGENWWCVVFPSLCLPAASEGFEAVAAGAGFPDGLTGALSHEEGHEVRFFLLDALGQLEIWLSE